MSFEPRNDRVKGSPEYSALVAATDAFEEKFPEYQSEAITGRELSIREYAFEDGNSAGYESGYDAAFDNEFVSDLKALVYRRDVLQIPDINVEEFVFDTFKQNGWTL